MPVMLSETSIFVSSGNHPTDMTVQAMKDFGVIQHKRV